MAWFGRMLKEALSPPLRGLLGRSAILWGLGDVGAQAITHYSTHQDTEDDKSISFVKKDKEFTIHWYRVFITSLYGLSYGASIGPVAHYRCARTRLPRSSTNTAEFVSSTPFKGLFGTLSLATFFPHMGYYQGRTSTMEQAKEDVYRGFAPAAVLGAGLLPVAQFTNWRFVPAPYQLHCASLFALLGSCYLSWKELEAEHKDGTGTQRQRIIQKQEGVRFDPTSVRSATV